MSDVDFKRLWSRETGVEVMLVSSSNPEAATEILTTAMSEYGLSVQTTSDRIRMFFEVTDTYLVIFLTLGGLGLLLGLFSLLVIVRKNLAASQSTIEQYRAMGFTTSLVRRLMYNENVIIPFFAIVVGAIGSVISISANVSGAGLSTILMAAVSLLVMCVCLVYGIRMIVYKII